MDVRNIAAMRQVVWPDARPIVGNGLLLPRSRLLIAGKYKARKSFLAIQSGLEIAAGRPLLGVFETRAVNVLYVNAEISEQSFVVERVLPMADTYSEAEERFFEAFTNYKLKLLPEHKQAWLDAIAASHAEVVIIDPLAEVAMGDENNKTSAQLAGDFLNALIDEAGVAVILIHHESKDLFYEGKRVDRGWDSMRGSSYWPGWLDAGIRVSRDPQKGTYHIAFLTRHTKEPDAMEFMWDEASKLFVPVREQGLSMELVRREFADDVILEQDLVSALSVQAQVHPMTVKRVLAGLIARGEVERQPWEKDKRKNVLRKTESWPSSQPPRRTG